MLQNLLGHMAAVPTLVICSGEDEYVPEAVSSAELATRISEAASGKPLVIQGNHALEGQEVVLAQHVCEFIASLSISV